MKPHEPAGALRFFIAVLLALLASSTGFSQPAIRAFLVFCNGYPGDAGAINTSVETDGHIVRNMLRDNISEPAWGVSLEMTEIQGEGATSEAVMAAYDDFAAAVAPDDTVFIHFSGHGLIPDPATNEQHLQFCDMKSLSRAAWADRIAALPARLRIFVTDCCSSYPVRELAEGPEVVNPWNSFYYLFRLHEGFVNITAASPGQDALGTERGGFLTVNLSSDMQRYKTWEEVFQRTQNRVFNETAEEIRGLGDPSLKPQRPLAYSLGSALFDTENADAKTPEAVKFVIPDSDRRLLGAEELRELSLQQLYFARNEIFARHGHDFTTPLLKYYFGDRFWYRRKEGMKSPPLSEIEKSNVATISAEESAKGGPFAPHDNMVIFGSNEALVANDASDQGPADIFPYSSNQPLTRVAVQDLTLQELAIARNEIYARHGFPFKVKALQIHFGRKPYYSRDESAVDPKLSVIEEQNLWLIRKIERLKGGPYEFK